MIIYISHKLDMDVSFSHYAPGSWITKYVMDAAIKVSARALPANQIYDSLFSGS